MLSLATLSLEYCKVVASARETMPRDFLREMLRYLPRIYMFISDLHTDEADTEAYETGAIYDSISEEQYNTARMDMEAVLGENDMFLDTPVEDMRYSDTPVAVSLAELLADVFQNMADLAATLAQATDDMEPEIVMEIKYRFATYLSDIICRALKAANYIYYNASFEEAE